jgi:hypothetical protein
MPRTSAEIAVAIDEFQPVDGEWLALDELVEELFQTESPESALGSLFRVFERYPTDDGAGVFWGILHGVESIPGYESHLAKSIQSNPSEFSVIMVHRLMNSGIEEVAGIDGQSLLEDVLQNQLVPEAVRTTAQRLYDKHRKST